MENVGPPLPRQAQFEPGRFERKRAGNNGAREPWERELRSDPIASWTGPQSPVPLHADPVSTESRAWLTGLGGAAGFTGGVLVSLATHASAPAMVGAVLLGAAVGAGGAWVGVGGKHEDDPAVVAVDHEHVDDFLRSYPAARKAVEQQEVDPGGHEPYVDAVLRHWDTSGDGTVDEQEARRKVEVQPRGLGTRERISVDLRAAFQKADQLHRDVGSQPDGRASRAELRRLMASEDGVFHYRDVAVKVEDGPRRTQFELERTAYRTTAAERGNFHLPVELRSGAEVVADRWNANDETYAVGEALLDS